MCTFLLISDNELKMLKKKKRKPVILQTVNWSMLCDSDLLLAVFSLQEFTKRKDSIITIFRKTDIIIKLAKGKLASAKTLVRER